MAATPGGTSVIEHQVRVEAPPETVFQYFTDPMKMVRWMGMEATLDPRAGGVCRINLNGSMMIGEFVQVDPPWRLVFTWGWETELFAVGPQSTAVEVSFTPDKDGTIVRLRHCRMPAAGVTFHSAGWEHYLERLAVAAAGGDPGRDSFLDVEVLARALGLGAPQAE